MSILSWDLIKSDDPRAGRLDRYDARQADSRAATRFFDRVKFLRLGGYPFAAAIVGAWRMGKGKPVYVNYPRRRQAPLYEFAPPTPSQMFARLGLLLVIALGFALVAEFLV
ncbi:MAG TPA: hypothetical protein VF886_00395 [Roseiarcus sp.]